MSTPGTPDAPLRVAIVGSGPSGFYSAGHLLLNKKHPDLVAQVDMYDRLPTPWGLVRGGVAPDHPNIKAVSRVYEKTAAHPEFRFFGNVEFGVDITHEDLRDRYHAVIYAVGAQTDRQMGIPGEDLPGSWAATEFVAWYNGHPDYRDLEFDLSHERAVVIGNGNVAADVARMLALTREELACTDIADHAIDPIADSGIKEIVVLGRRGPAQAAFTNPELLELGEMTDADVFVDPRDVELDPLSRSWLESEEAKATPRKNVEILTRLLVPRAGGQAAPDPAALPRLAGRDPGRRARRGRPHLPQRAARRGRLAARVLDRHDRGDRGGHRVPLDRLPGHPASRPALRRAPRRDPQRGRPHPRRGRRAARRRVRGRLDQARAHGHHRDQQARRAGDRGRA